MTRHDHPRIEELKRGVRRTNFCKEHGIDPVSLDPDYDPYFMSNEVDHHCSDERIEYIARTCAEIRKHHNATSQNH